MTLFGFDLSLRWYALSYVVGFIIASAVMKFFVHRKNLWVRSAPPMDKEQVDSLLTYMIIGVILGGRMGYVLFYNFEYYLENLVEVVQVWDGGMAFHGGFIGVVFAAYFYFSYHGISTLSGADLVALATPPGLFLGRVANFINSELWGRPTDMPWGVVFPGSAAQACQGAVGICARHPSQIYEALLEGLFLFFIVVGFSFLGLLKRPGFITGVFLFWYGISRFIVEFYRVPDPQFFSDENIHGFALNVGSFGMTMGQTLSCPMIVLGFFLILIARKKKTSGGANELTTDSTVINTFFLCNLGDNNCFWPGIDKACCEVLQ